MSENGMKGEYFQTDPILALAKDGQVVACGISGIRLDVGEPKGYLEAILRYASGIQRRGIS